MCVCVSVCACVYVCVNVYVRVCVVSVECVWQTLKQFLISCILRRMNRYKSIHTLYMYIKIYIEFMILVLNSADEINLPKFRNGGRSE